MVLEDLLKSRDARVVRQRELLMAHPGLSLLCLTVQLPGAVKRNDVSLTIARAGVEAVRSSFNIDYEEIRDLETGFEGFFMVEGAPMEAKRVACSIEDTHPLGRLMDLDVIVLDGCPVPLGREELGLPPRKCLLCENDARVCIRTRAHSTEDLLAKIEEMVNNYINL